MLSEIGSVENVRLTEDRLQRKAKMGFGHRVSKIRGRQSSELSPKAVRSLVTTSIMTLPWRWNG